jgi:SlyX protein
VDEREERLVEIEMKLARHENLIEQLNWVLYEQQKKIDQLERLLIEQGRAKSVEVGPHNVKPPHY